MKQSIEQTKELNALSAKEWGFFSPYQEDSQVQTRTQQWFKDFTNLIQDCILQTALEKFDKNDALYLSGSSDCDSINSGS